MDLVADRAAVITGAAQGIGEATAKTYAEHGASVVVADVDEEGGQATVDAIREADGEATFVHTDVSKVEDVQAMITTCLEEYGGIDVLYNNAGIDGPVAPIAEYGVEEFDEVIGVNLRGVFLGMKYGVEAMLEDGGGSIISTSSIAGHVAVPNYGGYAAAKAGLQLLTKNVAIEYADQGIRANAISPGIVRTPMIEAAMEADPDAEEQFMGMEPMPGMADPQEIANVALFLGSDLSSRVTGTTLPAEGGYISQ